MLTIQERSCKTTATRFLTIFDKKHNKCKFKSRLLGHSNGGRKNTYTSTYTRVGSTYHIWSRSKHIYPICFSKISFKYAILMKFDRQIEHHKNFEKVCPCLFQHQYFFAEVNIFKHFGKIFQNSPVWQKYCNFWTENANFFVCHQDEIEYWLI